MVARVIVAPRIQKYTQKYEIFTFKKQKSSILMSLACNPNIQRKNRKANTKEAEEKEYQR